MDPFSVFKQSSTVLPGYFNTGNPELLRHVTKVYNAVALLNVTTIQ